MQSLLDFLSSQRIMVVATHTPEPTTHPWVANLYYVVDGEHHEQRPAMYVFGHPNAKWALDIEQNPEVAFSVVWSNPADPADRKGVQAVANMRKSEEEQQLDRALALYSGIFPTEIEQFKQRVVSGDSGLYVVEPKFLKHWDDAEHGEEKFKSYSFE